MQYCTLDKSRLSIENILRNRLQLIFINSKIKVKPHTLLVLYIRFGSVIGMWSIEILLFILLYNLHSCIFVCSVLDMDLSVGGLLKDKEKVKDHLTNTMKVLSPSVVDAILSSKINLTSVSIHFHSSLTSIARTCLAFLPKIF